MKLLSVLKNKLFVNIFYYGLGDFIVTACSTFLLIPLYVSQLDTTEYGIFNIINNNTIIFTYIFQFGIISAFSRLYFTFKQREKKREYINSVIVFHLIYSAFLFLTVYLCSNLIFKVLSPSLTNVKFQYFSVIVSFLSFLPALYYGILRVENKASKFFMFQIITVSILLLMISVFFFTKRFNLSNLLIAQLFSGIIMFIIIIFLLGRSFALPGDYIDSIKNTLKLSLPIFIGYIAYFLISRYSIVILQKYITLSEIGIYTFAQQIAMLTTFLSAVIGKAIQPYIFSSSNDQLNQRVNLIEQKYKIFLVWFTCLVIFFIEDIFNLILPDNYLPAIQISRFLLFITLIYNFTLIENSVLLYHMKNKILLLITICGSGINFILNQLLVPHMKISGSIIAMFIAFSFTCLAQIYYSNTTVTKIKYNKAQLLLILSIIIF
ncbi:MAG: oligosaccharide flippase family protein, partial [Tannerellaceae bacterium]|nr:oligosaccharide flippase family protein [Tannerellaceae bacterium]